MPMVARVTIMGAQFENPYKRRMNMDAPDLSPTLATGHPDIDGQHRMLIHMIRELSAQIVAKEHHQGVLDALQGMLAYAATHFEDEEEIMEQADWDGLERHEGLHARFLWKTGDLKSRVQENSAQASHEALEFLLKWLVEHIKVEDRAFFKTLKR